MRYFKKYSFYLQLISFSVFFSAHAEEPVSSSYREKTAFQVGREIYVTGETIWYKAFAFSNHKKIYSKVLYVELVDKESQHILGQIVELKDGMASSSISIPDTLQTGSYFLKAYTNWMRNFNTRHFASFPFYIFNQYDESEERVMDYSLQAKPVVCIENGKLLHQANTRVKMEFPLWMSETVRGFLTETISGSKMREFLLNPDGKGFFTFIPHVGEKYKIELEAADGRTISYELPEVVNFKPTINVIGGEGDELLILPANLPVRTANYQIELRKENKLIWKKSITGNHSDTLYIGFDSFGQGSYSIRLLDRGKHILAEKKVYLNKKGDNSFFNAKRFRPRTSVEIPVAAMMDEELEGLDLSVSIYKSVPSVIQEEEGINTTVFDHHHSTVSAGGGFHVLLPLYQEITKENGFSDKDAEFLFEFPVEDIGILYSGKVVNSINNGALSGVEVILSEKDTIPRLLFSNTDKQGRFFFLIDDYGEKHAMINLYLLGTQLSGSFKIMLDKKFHYQKNPEFVEMMVLNKEDEPMNYLDDEAKRVMIQRAFGREKAKSDPGYKPKSDEPFYDKSAIVVHPSEYFDLPNFEEIAREILPKVRYKYASDGCEVSIFHKDHGIKTTSPVVLLDGLPIKDNCEIYSLKSEDINRIEIISGGHVSGNLFYAGILAIYSSSSFKRNNEHTNGRFFHDVSGYTCGSKFPSPNFDTPQNRIGTEADFKNQLFWNADFTSTKTIDTLQFYTSDEEGDYIIDICGYTNNGQLLEIKRTFNVVSEQ